MGITAVLTVYGSVGREYPIFNIPVINASINNPHSGYNFNYHNKTIKKYEKLILNIKKLRIDPNECERKIYEHYAARYSNYNIINDFRTMILNVKYREQGYLLKAQVEDSVFKSWMNNFSIKRHNQIKNDIKSFIYSKKIRMLADNTKGFSKLINN